MQRQINALTGASGTSTYFQLKGPECLVVVSGTFSSATAKLQLVCAVADPQVSPNTTAPASANIVDVTSGSFSAAGAIVMSVPCENVWYRWSYTGGGGGTAIDCCIEQGQFYRRPVDG